MDKDKVDKLYEKGDFNGLAEILEHNSDWFTRLEAAEALYHLNDPRGIEYLIGALHDPDEEESEVAREILAELNDPHGNRALNDWLVLKQIEPVQGENNLCENCNSENPANAIFCQHCGTKLPEQVGEFEHLEEPVDDLKSMPIKLTYKSGELINEANEEDLDPREVEIVNIDIPFSSLVYLLVKVALASIPALLILVFISAIISLLFGGMLAALIQNF